MTIQPNDTAPTAGTVRVDGVEWVQRRADVFGFGEYNYWWNETERRFASENEHALLLRIAADAKRIEALEQENAALRKAAEWSLTVPKEARDA